MLLNWLADWKRVGRVIGTKKRSSRRDRLKTPGAPAHAEVLEDRTLLAAIIVNSLEDAPIAADGALTLREAIQAANTGTTVGDATGDAGLDTITFSLSGTILLDDLGGFGDYLITEDVTIDGGDNITINGQGLNRIFDIENAGTVTLIGLTLTGGDGTSDSTGNTANDGRGGAIFNTGTDLILTNMTIMGNTAGNNGGGIFNDTASTATIDGGSMISGNTAGTNGGGIFTQGMLTVDDSTIDDNSATTNGGGISISSTGSATIQNGSMISGNTAAVDGGGISSLGTATIQNGTIISNNTAGTDGGGIFAIDTLQVTGSTIMGNTAGNNGGGIFNDTASTATIDGGSMISGNIANIGGGIFNGGTLSVDGSTISMNSATLNAGGIANIGTAMIQNGSTISSNTAINGGGIFSQTGMTIDNSTVSMNSALALGGGIITANGITLIIQNGSLISANTAGTNGGGIFTQGMLTVDDSTVDNNSATINGGGIGISATGSATIQNGSMISGNTASVDGGGIFSTTGGTLEFADSTLMNNIAGVTGGGIENDGILTLSGTATTLGINDPDTVSGSGNVTSSPTGTVTFATGTLSTYTGTTTLTSGTTFVNGTIDDDGTPGNGSAGTVTVQSGATLGGTGTIDATVNVESGGTVSPGTSPGILNVGDTNFMAGAMFVVEVNGVTTAGTDYDQLNVTGTVNIDPAAILVTSGTVTSAIVGDVTIINNDGADLVAGTFSGLPEGAMLTINGVEFRISYIGGDGNDVVLTVVSADLVITKDDVPDPVVAGQNITYTVSVTNNGPFDALDVVMMDPIPVGATFAGFVSITQGTGMFSGGLVTANFGTVTEGSTATLVFIVTADASLTNGTTINNQATVASSTLDADSSNNTVIATTVVVATNVVFVNDDFTGANGTVITDADPNTPGDQTAIIGVNAFDTIQEGVDAVDAGGSVFITDDLSTDGPGMYVENVTINKDLQIIGTEGDPSAVIVDGNQAGSVFTILVGNTVTIDSITIQNGSTAASGGGINNAGNLTLNNSVVQNNNALDGGGIANLATLSIEGGSLITGNSAIASGGGILTQDTLTVNASTIDDNTASNGGGIASVGGTTTVENNSMISSNITNSTGGGIANNAGMLTLDASTVTGNTSDSGAGIINIDGTATIQGGSIVTANTAQRGGGILNLGGSTIVTASTISNNIATGNAPTDGGGGIDNLGGDLTVQGGSVISLNQATGISGSGGGILNNGTATIEAGSMITGNSATSDGGGIFNAGTLTVDNSTIGDSIIENDVWSQSADANDLVFVFVDAQNSTAGQNVLLDVLENDGTTVIDNNNLGISAGGTVSQGGSVFYNVQGDPNAGDPVTPYQIYASVVDPSLAIAETEGNDDSGSANPIAAETLVTGSLGSSTDADVFSLSIAAGSSLVVILDSLAGTDAILEILDTDGTTVRATGTVDAFSLDSAAIASGLAAGTYYIRVTGNAGATGGYQFVAKEVAAADQVAETEPNNTPATANLLSASQFGQGNLVQVGSNTAVRGGGIFNDATGTVTVTNLSLISNNTATGNASTDGGGGIYNDGGMVTVQDFSQISFNSATGTSGSGGGIFNNAGSVSVIDSTIVSNTANRAGGGVEALGGTTIITDSSLESNVAGPSGSANPGNGGGLHISGAGNVTISGGNVTNNTAAEEGGGIWNSSTGMITIQQSPSNTLIQGNLANGNLTEQGGGGIFNDGGTIAIIGATIDMNVSTATAAGNGGGGIFNRGTVNLIGANVTNNTSSADGGGIVNSTGATFTVNGGNITGNSAAGDGGGIFSDGNLTLQNTVSVSGNSAGSDGGGIFLGTNSGAIAITSTIINGNTASGAAATNGGGGIFVDDNVALTLGATVSITNNLANGTLGSGGGIFADTGASLNLTGTTITGNTAERAGGGIEDNSGSTTTLVLTDIILNNNLARGTGTAPGNGGGLHITGAGTATISGGSITNNTAAEEGGGIWNSSTGGITIQQSLSNTLIQGNIANGDLTEQGGGGIFNDGGTIDIIGATINMNVSTATAIGNGGGGIFNRGTVNLTGVDVTNNTAANPTANGGGILNSTGATLSINGGNITGNTAARAGGGIENNAGTVTIFGNANVSGNSAGVNGGGLHTSGAGTATITGGTIQNNTAGQEGGGLWNSATGTLTVDGTAIMGNTALAGMNASNDQGGGGVFNDGGTLDIDNATIAGNSATANLGNGGGVMSVGGTVTINDSAITDNSAAGDGGGVNAADSDLTVDNVTFSGNSADGSGGGLFLSGTGTVSITNAMVSQNAANGTGAGQGGGGIFNNLDSTLVLDSSISILGNSAANNGGGIFNAGELTVDGALIGDSVLDNDVWSQTATANDLVFVFVDTQNSTAGTDVLLDVLENDGLTVIDNNNLGISAGGTVTQGGSVFYNVQGDPMSGSPVTPYQIYASVVDPGAAIAETESNEDFTTANAITAESLVTGTLGSGTDADVFSITVVDANSSLVVILDSLAGTDAILEILDTDGMTVLATGTVDAFSLDSAAIASGLAAGTYFIRVMGNAGATGDYQFVAKLVTAADQVSDTGSNNTAATANPLTMSQFGQGNLPQVGSNTALRGGGIFNASTGTTLVTGLALISNNTATGNASTDGGGGIYNDGGMLTVDGFSQISFNSATGTSGSGGGIFNNTGGTVMVTDASITNNTANRAGGGIEDNSGAGLGVTLANVTLNDNVAQGAPGNGGGLHVTGAGDVMMTGGTVSGNSAALEGGGLWNGSGTMTIVGTTINGNTASGDAADDGGGGIFNNAGTVSLSSTVSVTNNLADGTSGSGGGIFNNTGGTLSINGSTITGNTANRAGGGIEDNSGAGLGVTLTNVTLNNNVAQGAPGNGGGLHVTGAGDVNITGGTVSGNSAANEGGGLWNGSGKMTIVGTTLNGNTANFGGGIFNNTAGTATLNTSTVSGNTSANAGGGVDNLGTFTATASTLSGNTANQGGGISNAGTLSLTNVTISGNGAANAGGGLYTETGTATISNSTIANNQAATGGGINSASGTVTLTSTIVATNATGDISGTVAGTFNLVGVDTGLLGLTDGVDNNQVGTAANPIDPRLGPLAFNGGPTMTHAILPDSPALNAGSNPDMLDFDQRLAPFVRQFGGQTDIGAFELQSVNGGGNDIIVTAKGPGVDGMLQVINAITQELMFTINPYPGFCGGIRVAVGDVNGDGIPDIITGAGPGGGAHIRVFDGRDGVNEFYSFFAFDSTFTGGVFVASADLNGDNMADIIVSQDAGGMPLVRVFSGADGSELFNFLAFGAGFGGGVRVAAGDITGDGTPDIIAGAGPGAGPHVRVFDGSLPIVGGGFAATNIPGPLGSFYAFDQAFSGGVFVAAGDVNGDGRIDLIVSADAGAGPHVRVFDGDTGGQLAGPLGSFYAYDQAFAGGVRVAAADITGDGLADIITVPGQGGGPHLRAFDAASVATPEIIRNVFVEDPNFTGGIFVAASVRLESGLSPALSSDELDLLFSEGDLLDDLLS